MDKGPRSIYIALGYLCWILAMVLGFLILVSARELGLAVVAIQEVDIKLVALIDKIGFFAFGVVGLVIIILTEGYFRTGVLRGILAERVSEVLGIGLLSLCVLDAVRLVLPGLIDRARPGVAQTALSLILGGLCVWFCRRVRRHRLS